MSVQVMQKQAIQGSPQQSTECQRKPKREINNKLLSTTRTFSDTSPTFGQFPDISLTAAKFPTFPGFSESVHPVTGFS